MLRTLVAAIVPACALAACARGSPPPYDLALRAKQAELVHADRAYTARRHAAIALIVTGTARDVTPENSTAERFVVRFRNHGARALRRVDGGLLVFDAGGRRLGLSTFSSRVDVPAGRTATTTLSIPLASFAAEGAGALARASGRSKRVEIELTGYQLEDGGRAGEAD